MVTNVEHFDRELLTAAGIGVIKWVTSAQPLLLECLSVFICKALPSGLACLPRLEDCGGDSDPREGEACVSFVLRLTSDISPTASPALSPPTPGPSQPQASYLSSSSLRWMAPGPWLPLGA